MQLVVQEDRLYNYANNFIRNHLGAVIFNARFVNVNTKGHNHCTIQQAIIMQLGQNNAGISVSFNF